MNAQQKKMFNGCNDEALIQDNEIKKQGSQTHRV